MWKQYQKLYEVALSKSRAKEEKLMCETLNRLRGKSAEDILNLAEQEKTVPVNMDKLFNVWGIQKQASDFAEIEKIEDKGKIYGLVTIIGDDVRIFFGENDDVKQKRFTAAHEIGHCCLHGDMLKDDYIEFLHNDGFENEHETAASEFAAKLLIPSKALNKVYHAITGLTVEDLSEIFQVPEKLMRLRLKEEKLK